MRTRHGALAALPLALVLGLTGCGSADDSGGGGGGGGDSDQSRYDDQLKFAACMREHGVDMEDPKPGEGIQIESNGGAEKERTDAAVEACQGILPPPDAEFEEGEREGMLEYARCMRDNGVEAFADPQPGAGINIGPEVAEDPDFERAQSTCDAEIFGGAPDRHEHTNGG